MRSSVGARYRMSWWLVVGFWLASIAPAAADLVIESLPTSDPFDQAGLRPGDILDRWQVERGDDEPWRGRLGTFVDWRYLRDEILPRDQPIQLLGRRSTGEPLAVEVAGSPWRARVRPTLDEATLDAFVEGRQAISDGRRADGLSHWRRQLDAALALGERATAVWLALRISRDGDPRADDAIVRPALERVLEDAIGLRERTVLLETLLLWEMKRGDFGAAEPLLHEALDRNRQAGDPIGTARCLYRLGFALVRSGDPARAEPFYVDALAIYRDHAPDGLAEAATRIGLGHTSALLGDLRVAEDHWLRSLALYEALSPSGGERVGVLYNLGSVAATLGDLAGSERYLFQALDLQGEQGDPLHRARALNNLAEVAMRQGELDRAIEYLDESLQIKREHAPDDVVVSTTLANLGHIAMRREDSERATAYFAEALAHVRRVQPGTLHEAIVLENSARAALAAQQLDDAEARLQAAWTIVERTAPDGPVAVSTLHTMAEVAAEAGDLDTAIERYERAAAEIEKAVPGTQSEVEVLGDLAEVRVRRGQLAEAAALFDRALAALENQIEQVGGSPDRRHRFRSAYHRLYRRQVEVLVDLDRIGEAFAVVERSRARGLLELFAGRDLELREVPADLDRRHRRLVARYSREVHRLATLQASPEREGVLAELASLRRQRDDVAESMWRQAPRVAELHYPRPLDAPAARDVLPRGALLLSWSVGEERTVLFAMRKDEPMRAIVLPVGEAALEHRIDRFVRWIREPTAAPGSTAGADAGLRRVARQLGDDLLGPVAADILAAERVILSPDGPLHRLPFAALRLDLDGGERWMVEIRPMSTTPSVTVLDELTRRSRSKSLAVPRLAAFGAPILPRAETQTADARRSFLDEPTRLSALPASEREVSAVADIFPGAEAFLGERATEARVKAVAPAADVLHFATHALVDADAPLESALVLSLPEAVGDDEENGLLQAWEIFEDLRLDAELVVLSACGTALGAPVRGEGLIGLERAFQFAGARSVVASLWPVSDQATARLMERFYRHLRAGSDRDEALRRAQMAALTETPTGADAIDPSAPVHWAAFRLSGAHEAIVRAEP